MWSKMSAEDSILMILMMMMIVVIRVTAVWTCTPLSYVKLFVPYFNITEIMLFA